MRAITEKVCSAFVARRAAKLSNTESTGMALYLHGNKIAEWRPAIAQPWKLWITNAGWRSNTTKERLNGIPGVSITQKNYTWYLNGREWSGEWIEVK